MRPLDRIRSIKFKLGVVIVAAVAGTVLLLAFGKRLGLTLEARVFVAAVFGLGMVQILARGMTSPLREMAAAAKEMAKGDYDRRVTATSRDEVGELAHAFNAMAGELADADRMRRELVANVSHELRTPLGALQALLENLADGVEPPDPARLRVALAQTERLGRLVEQLLDLSRFESGVLELRREPFGVRGLLEQAVRECALGERLGAAEGLRRPRRSADDRRSRAAAPGRREPARQRRPALAAGGPCLAHRPRGHDRPDARSWSPTRGPASRRPTPSGSSSASTASTRRARPATAAPASGSRSRAGSSTPTAARSAPRAASRAAAG